MFAITFFSLVMLVDKSTVDDLSNSLAPVEKQDLYKSCFSTSASLFCLNLTVNRKFIFPLQLDWFKLKPYHRSLSSYLDHDTAHGRCTDDLFHESCKGHEGISLPATCMT